MRRIRFHDLRHTFGTRMAAEGAPMRAIQAWYGHKDSKTTAIYVDYQPDEAESALVDRAFGGLTFSPQTPPKVRPTGADENPVDRGVEPRIV